MTDSPRANAGNCKLFKAVSQRLRDGFARLLYISLSLFGHMFFKCDEMS